MGPAETACPHCAKPSASSSRRRWGAVLGIAGVASLGLTMMACYGAPPCEPHCQNPNADANTKPDGGATP